MELELSRDPEDIDHRTVWCINTIMQTCSSAYANYLDDQPGISLEEKSVAKQIIHCQSLVPTKMGEQDPAIKELIRMLQTSKMTSSMRVICADTLGECGLMEAAMEQFHLAIQSAKGSEIANACYKKFINYLLSYRAAPANILSLCNSFVDSGSALVEDRLFTASIALKFGDISQAKRHVQVAFHTDVLTGYEANILLEFVLDELGDKAFAEELVTKRMKQDHLALRFWIPVGRLIGERLQNRGLAKKLFTADNDDFERQFHYASSAIRQGNAKSLALNIMERWFRKYKSNVHERADFGLFLADYMGDIKAAQEHFRVALSETPGLAATREKHASFLLKHGDILSARSEIEAALMSNPTNDFLRFQFIMFLVDHSDDIKTALQQCKLLSYARNTGCAAFINGFMNFFFAQESNLGKSQLRLARDYGCEPYWQVAASVLAHLNNLSEMQQALTFINPKCRLVAEEDPPLNVHHASFSYIAGFVLRRIKALQAEE